MYIHSLFYIFFSKTFPHLEQTNFVFPLFPFTPIIVPAMAPAGPKRPQTRFPVAAFVSEKFFLVSTGIPTPSHPHLRHFTGFDIVYHSPLLYIAIIYHNSTIFSLFFKNKKRSCSFFRDIHFKISKSTT